jgi:hypothetical protein
MPNLKWHLFAIRTRIEMRMNQLNLSLRLRERVVGIISRITDLTRLTALANRLDAKQKRTP